MEKGVTRTQAQMGYVSSVDISPGPHRLWWGAGGEEAIGPWCLRGNFKKGAGQCGLLSPYPG